MSLFKSDPAKVDIDGKPFKCLVCTGELFHRRKSHLDTALMGSMSPQWTDASAYCLVCDRCGHIELFYQR